MNVVDDQIWSDFLKIVKEEVGSRVVETWIKAVSFSRYDHATGSVYLVVPNLFVKNWVKTNYQQLFEVHLKRLLGIDSITILFCLDSAEQEARVLPVTSTGILPAVSVKKSATKKYEVSKSTVGYWNASKLNALYSFDTFVVGENNSFAYASARAAVQKLGRLYNPLLLYGGSGLGKTHLLHAIGNEVLKINSSTKVLYQTTDRFITEFINSIRFDQVAKFQSKYREVDVLLVDDIQFMVNKEQTQEAFFHIFNNLYDSNKQIVFSSDTLPRHLGGLADRLKSRLEWGLVADIQVPMHETKIAILKRKAELQKDVLSDEVASFIASQSISSVRELEGALIRVLAYASLTNQSVSVGLVKKVLGHHEAQTEKKAVGFGMIVQCVEKYFAYNLSSLRSKDRSKALSIARQSAMYLMKKNTSSSLKEIGEYLDRKDHTTITHAVQRITGLRQIDDALETKLKTIEQELYS